LGEPEGREGSDARDASEAAVAMGRFPGAGWSASFDRRKSSRPIVNFACAALPPEIRG
jgi:hypothetical protein